MTEISGPVNLARLEGDINGVKKVVYLFMNININSYDQTECKSFDSVSIKNYLINNFKKAENETKIDFFLDHFPDAAGMKGNYTDTYSGNIRDFFNRSFEFNFEKNEVKRSKHFPNVRLHYIDIRSYFTSFLGSPSGSATDIIKYMRSLEIQHISVNDLVYLKDSINILHSEIGTIVDIFVKPSSKAKKALLIRQFNPDMWRYTVEETIKTVEYISNKIRNDYRNDSIKQTMNKIIDKEFGGYIDEYLKTYNDMIDAISTFITDIDIKPHKKIEYNGKANSFFEVKRDIIYDNYCKLMKIGERYYLSLVVIYSAIMDYYLLRRILDKKYVTNAIVYGDITNSVKCIYYLVKYFGFNVTHTVYSDVSNVKELNDRIKEEANIHNVESVFLPDMFIQCIDMASFPENFM